jgi:hypothetical protein
VYRALRCYLFRFEYADRSHQTTEITRLQVGEGSDDVRLLATSLSEAENLVPLLVEYQQKGLQANVQMATALVLNRI